MNILVFVERYRYLDLRRSLVVQDLPVRRWKSIVANAVRYTGYRKNDPGILPTAPIT